MSKKPHIKPSDRWAFWEHDEFPFTCAGRIREEPEGKPCPEAREGRVYVPSFQMRVKPFLILEGLEGARLKADLDALEEEHRKAQEDLRRRFKVRLNARLRADKAKHPNVFVRHPNRQRASRIWNSIRENGDRP